MKTKIKILYIIATLSIGGTEKQLIELVKILDREKYESAVCCLTRGGPLEKDLKDAGIRLFILGKKGKWDFGIIFKLAGLIRQEKPVIVHTFLWTSNTWGRIAAKLAGVPIIISAERCMVTPWKGYFYRVLDAILSGFSDIIVANSEPVRISHIKEEGIHSSKIITIYNGVDVQKFNPNIIDAKIQKKLLRLEESLPVIGIVGRLEKNKGYEYFLEAAKQVLQSKTVKFLIVGDGSLRIKLEKIAGTLGIYRNILFAGYRENMAEVLSTIDVLVISSLSEGSSNVILEGMAMAKPIVATNIPSNTELISDGKTGLLVPPADSDALSESILSLLNNPGLCDKIGREARIYVGKEYSVLKVKEKTEKLYAYLIKKLKRILR